MPPLVSALLALVSSLLRSRWSLHLQVLALQHQVAVYQQTVRRPRLSPMDRVFWSWLSWLWAGWPDVLALVQPRTVMAWQRTRFRNYWRGLSQRGKPGRPAIPKEVRELIRKMWRANPMWGSPRIVGELRKLGIEGAKYTVEKYRVPLRKPPTPTWKAFLNNHRQDLVSLDFFTVPTVTYKVLFVLLILTHQRRRVVHFNVTEHPTAEWTAQQVLEAFPWDDVPRYLLRDRDRIYGAGFRQRLQHLGIEEVLIAPRSPWQNPFVEWLIGSIRRECLDHVVVFHDRHLQRILACYLAYYHRWRTHLSLAMDCPEPRPIQQLGRGKVVAVPEVDGLHHHDEWQAA
jgi:putative transposase